MGLFRFLVSPEAMNGGVPFGASDSFFSKVGRVIGYFLLAYMLNVALMFVITSVIGDKYVLSDKVFSLISSDMSYYLIVLLVAVLFPLLEEIMFRLPMVYNKFNISIMIGVVAFYLFSGLVAYVNLISTAMIFVRITVGVLFAILVYSILWYYDNINSIFNKFWKNYFWVVFYSLSISFGLLHSVNFAGSGIPYYLLPLLTLPQLLVGLMIGYFRMRYGFFYGYSIHFMNNSLSLTFMFIALKLKDSIPIGV